MLNKVLYTLAVLLVAAAMAMPAFAAQSADLSMEWGSQDWLINQFGGQSGDVTTFCQTAGKSADTIASWGKEFPGLYDLCGWPAPQQQ